MTLHIKPGVWIDDRDLEWRFVRASGPGGQNVNKVATAVQLRFDVEHARGLPGDVRERLVRLAGRRMTGEGALLIEARRHRSQEQNKQDALDRLAALLRRAAEQKRPRKKTRPSRAAKRRRLDAKARRGQTKKLRGSVTDD